MGAEHHLASVVKECDLVPRWYWVCACGAEARLNFAEPDQAMDDSAEHVRTLDLTKASRIAA